MLQGSGGGPVIPMLRQGDVISNRDGCSTYATHTTHHVQPTSEARYHSLAAPDATYATHTTRPIMNSLGLAIQIHDTRSSEQACLQC